MRRVQLTPQLVERWTVRDVTAMIASTTVALASLVLLGDFVIHGATAPVVALLVMTLTAQSITLICHSRAPSPARTLQLRWLTRMRTRLRTTVRT